MVPGRSAGVAHVQRCGSPFSQMDTYVTKITFRLVTSCWIKLLLVGFILLVGVSAFVSPGARAVSRTSLSESLGFDFSEDGQGQQTGQLLGEDNCSASSRTTLRGSMWTARRTASWAVFASSAS